MNKNTIRLTESELKKIITESVKKFLKEGNPQADLDRRWYEYVQEEKRKHQELVNFLKRYGINSAELSETQGGLPVVAMDTDEYNNSNARIIADNFVKGKREYISSNSYPATTYLRIDTF